MGRHLREAADLVMMACPADPQVAAEVERDALLHKLQARVCRRSGAPPMPSMSRLKLAVRCLK